MLGSYLLDFTQFKLHLISEQRGLNREVIWRHFGEIIEQLDRMVELHLMIVQQKEVGNTRPEFLIRQLNLIGMVGNLYYASEVSEVEDLFGHYPLDNFLDVLCFEIY